MLKGKKGNKIKKLYKEKSKSKSLKAINEDAFQKVLVKNENSELEQVPCSKLICKKCEKPINTGRVFKINDFYFHE